jgi:chorismate synthase
MNTFGRLFRITTFGESHGAGIGVVIDGIPGNFPVDLAEVEQALRRRRPGQNPYTSPRQEEDKVEVLSGLYQGKLPEHPSRSGYPIRMPVVQITRSYQRSTGLRTPIIRMR